jgi:DNA-directed RNA polymerase alpha subunit
MPSKKKAKSSILTPKIDIIGKEAGTYKFTISNTDLSIVNAIRRVILSDIPIFAMKEFNNNKKMIDIKKNTSQFNNQIIIQRLGCIPVHIDDITKNVENLLIELNLKNDSDELLYITTNDITIKQLIDDEKTAGELPEKTVNKIFPPNNYTKDHILIARLKPKITEDILGEELHFTAKLSKCTAKESGMFNVVSQCAYGYSPDPVKQHDAEVTFEEKLKAEDVEENMIEFEMNNWKNHQSKRYYTENSYDFKMESIGIYENEKIVEIACNIIKKRIEIIKEKIEKGVLKIETEKIALNHSYDITLENEDYTVGKVLEYILHYKYYLDLDKLNYIGFLKPHPHDSDSLIRLAFKNETDFNNEMLYSILLDTCNISIKLFDVIKENFK